MITIALATVAELIRRRFALAALGGVVITAALSAWGFHHLVTFRRPSGATLTVVEIHEVAMTLLPLILYALSFILAFAATVIGAAMLSAEVESGVLLPVLARPISRAAIVLGKALGLGFVLAVYAGFSVFLEFAIVDLTTGYLPPHPFAAAAALIALAFVVLALVLTLATRLQTLAASIISIVAFGAAWILGIVASFGPMSHSETLIRIGVVSQLLFPTDAMWRVAAYQLEPPGLAAQLATRGGWAGPFFVLAPPPPSMLAWTAAWIVVVLAIGVRSFNTRDV